MDYISRALVADALAEWREQLRGAATVSPLRDLSASDAATIEINKAHPGGLAQLFAHRPTLLSTLIREDAGYRAAVHRGGLILAQAHQTLASTGQWSAALAVGTACWGGYEVPILLRTLALEPSRDGDLLVTLHQDAWINPVFGAYVRELGSEAPLAELAAASVTGPQFDPRPTWAAVRELGYLFGEDFQVSERLLIGAFDDPEQRLLDDLDLLDGVIGASDVIAAAAGDQDARTILNEPIPRWGTADRDPFSERGIGDLDDVAFAALDLVASARSLTIAAPPGSDPESVVAAIAADAAAAGRTLAVVGGSDAVVQSVAKRLDQLGAGDLYVTGAVDAWNADARARLLASLTLDVPQVDEAALARLGEGLLEARHELRERYDSLHRPHRPWGVSAFEAVQAVVRLTRGSVAPQTSVRLGTDAAAIVADHGLAGVASAIVKRIHGAEAAPVTSQIAPATAAIEAAAARPPMSWWSGLVPEEQGAHLDEALATLVRLVSAMRTEAATAARETGLDEAESLAAWAEQVTLFTDVRATLDLFSPAVYHRSLADLITATAPLGTARAGAMNRRERRALMRRAAQMLRPGREREPLHEKLLAAHDEQQRWRAHCSAGGWPSIPDAFDAYAARLLRVQAAWSVFTEPLDPARAEELALAPWDVLIAELERLSDGIPGGIEHAPARPAEVDLDAPGFGPLLAELGQRQAPAEQIRADLEFAWWGAAFEGIVEISPELTEYGAIGAAVERYLAYDAAFGDARLGPLLRAAGERRRAAIAAHPDAARDLFASLVEGVGGSLRALVDDFGPVVWALRPAVLCTADQVAHLLPPELCIDTVVLVGVESLALAEVVPAIARASQVVVVADVGTATRSAVRVLADLLPQVALPAMPQPRDPRVSRVLAENVYGRVLPAVPLPGEGSPWLRVVSLDAVAQPAVGSETVESSRAEVAAVTEHVARAADSVPRRSLAVVAGNELHAARIVDALRERDPRLAEATSVVPVGDAAGVRAEEVVLAVGYARDMRGHLPADLGVLGSPQGLTALTQAVVAGTQVLTVMTALEPHHLTHVAANAEPGHGIGMLRELVMAEERPFAAPERPRPGPADWLLADVAAILRADGLAVHIRYGFGSDAIPMVVGGPHDRGYRVAVITDEAAPPGAGSLRDRVRWQFGRLEVLGWRVVALWTADVFMDPQAAARDIKIAVAGEDPLLTGATPQVSDAEDSAATSEQTADEVEAWTPNAAADEVEDFTEDPGTLFGDVEYFVVDGPWEPGPEPDLEPEPELDSEPEPGTDLQTAAEPETEQPVEPTPPVVAKAADDKPVADKPLIPTRAWEDEDAAWGGGSGQSRDDDIRREKPPHW